MALKVFLLLSMSLGFSCVASAIDLPPVQLEEWHFSASLDGKDIGEHRFTIRPIPTDHNGWQVESRARYDIRFLGVLVYRYRHHAQETWKDGCLTHLSAVTDDDGDQIRVEAQQEGEHLQITVFDKDSQTASTSTQIADKCVMTFAYWNPAIRQNRQLLNPQTGELEKVIFKGPDASTFTQQGQERDAERWRIKTDKGPIDIWYDAAGRWIGLNARVAGDRQLRYQQP